MGEELPGVTVPSVLKAHRPSPAKVVIIEQALRILKDVMPAVDDETISRIGNRLNNDSLFAKAVRSAKSE